MINDRQKKLLYLIVYDYIKYGNPVSSFSLLKNNDDILLSSATIRNEMLLLEKEGFIEKAYKSSGRVPTNKGYEFYIKNIKESNKNVDSIKERIDLIFDERKKDIDKVIEEAIEIIVQTTNTFAISHEDNNDIKIEDMRFYKIDENKFIAIVIDSKGRLFNTEIISKSSNGKKIEKALKIISKRIIGSKIIDLEDRINYILELVSFEINDIENDFQKFIIKLFKEITNNNRQTSGLGNIVKMDFYDKKEQIEKIINIIQENSIWELIDKSKSIKNNNTEILIGLEEENLDDISIINKTFQLGDSKKQIAFIGSKNQDYEKIMNIINVLEKKIKE